MEGCKCCVYKPEILCDTEINVFCNHVQRASEIFYSLKPSVMWQLISFVFLHIYCVLLVTEWNCNTALQVVDRAYSCAKCFQSAVEAHTVSGC